MAMGGQGQMMLMGMAIVLGLAGAGYITGKMGTKTLTQNILNSVEATIGLHDVALDYAKISATGDFQGISPQVLYDKGILPTGMEISGAYAIPAYDTNQKFSIDPVSSGRKVKITLDATGDGYSADELQTFEDKFNSTVKKAGADIEDYTSTGADGIISATFQ